MIFCFCSPKSFRQIKSLLNDSQKLLNISTLEELESLVSHEQTTNTSYLISFGIGVIIPEKLLNFFSVCINVHAASPSYPGRDPHHYAIYEGASQYGAVAHFMEKTVDSGEIIDSRFFDIPPGINSVQLLDLANQCSIEIICNLIKNIIEGKKIVPNGQKWEGIKRKRDDLLNATKLAPYVSKEEVDKKYRAFQEGVSYRNLHIDLHGYRFRFEGKIKETIYNSEIDFTLSCYEKYLKKAQKQGYNFVGYHNWADSLSKPTLLLRHDLDASVEQAVAIANIENKLGIKSTFFIMLTNCFYDIRDPDTYKKVQNIIHMGHNVALHYDVDYIPAGKVMCFDSFSRTLALQKNELEKILKCKIHSFSIHNPDFLEQNLFETINEHNILEGMFNACSHSIMNQFKYCSDSNGLWRFDKFEDLIDANQYPFLYILIHPEWWTESFMTRKQKIEESLLSRVRRVLLEYEKILKQYGRPEL